MKFYLIGLTVLLGGCTLDTAQLAGVIAQVKTAVAQTQTTAEAGGTVTAGVQPETTEVAPAEPPAPPPKGLHDRPQPNDTKRKR